MNHFGKRTVLYLIYFFIYAYFNILAQSQILAMSLYLEIVQITLTLGIKLEEYDEHYCNAFQPTFNEHGFCYTFNNPDASLDNTFQG